MNKGDIIWADNRTDHPHPIIFLEQKSSGTFSACIITHGQISGNIKMEEEHFYKVDENNSPYSIQYDDSYFVPQRLSKEYNWITNETVKGKLTKEGVKYVESKISQKAESQPKPVWDWDKD